MQYKAKYLLVAAKVQQLCRYEKKDLRMSREFPIVLAIRVEKMILEACERAVLNGRHTVMSKDL